MKKTYLLCGLGLLAMSCSHTVNCEVQPSESDLVFEELATSWDEAVPLGNAEVGALVWQKGENIRLSLDRTDLWDLHPSDSMSGSNYRFEWVKEQIRKKDYLPVQQKFDIPYGKHAAPSKIPGAALEFSLSSLGSPKQVHLYLNNALCDVTWENGVSMQTFVHATEPIGWFVFKNLQDDLQPAIIAPQYKKSDTSKETNVVDGQDLQRLGYDQGVVTSAQNRLVYHQKGYNDFYYDVVVDWKREGSTLYGAWSITSSLSADKAVAETSDAMKRGLEKDYQSHMDFWTSYWNASSVSIPDPLLQKQYDNEMYKYGSATREYSYPISLQAVWTADNGKLPPWKGDYHHDLNTQLSYWPTYIGNHLKEGLGYINTLWNQQDTYKRYTKQFFGTDGINVPGVCTLMGEPMGGWMQYSMSQTVSAWLAQHFYLHWKYSADQAFLMEKGYPFMKQVALHLEQQTYVNADGKRTLEFSTSPEIYDNSLKAWFHTITNYDLALIKFVFGAAQEMASSLDLSEESAHWKQLASQLPAYDLGEDGALTFAKGFPYNESHRHFSNAMAIHPLGLIDWSDGKEAQHIIEATLKRLEDYSPDFWCGYSYSWLANMYARAFKGEKAAEALHVFAECFCLKNTFHANGDQTNSGKSKLTYRPFTLEGNFAFASGVQEMLLQSHTGVIRVFPAIPAAWKNVSFRQLRAMGAFLVSAEMKEGKVVTLSVYSEKGGKMLIVSPVDGKVVTRQMQAGETVNVLAL